jgi:hypothetical protein
VAAKPDRSNPSVRRGRRVAQIAYTLFAAAFIATATWEVQKQVFAGPPPGDSATNAGCSYSLLAFEEAVTSGLALGSQMHTLGKALEEFQDKTSTALSSVEKHCQGRDAAALATAQRMRDVAQASLQSQQTALAPLRTEVRALANP